MVVSAVDSDAAQTVLARAQQTEAAERPLSSADGCALLTEERNGEPALMKSVAITLSCRIRPGMDEGILSVDAARKRALSRLLATAQGELTPDASRRTHRDHTRAL